MHCSEHSHIQNVSLEVYNLGFYQRLHNLTLLVFAARVTDDNTDFLRRRKDFNTYPYGSGLGCLTDRYKNIFDVLVYLCKSGQGQLIQISNQFL